MSNTDITIFGNLSIIETNAIANVAFNPGQYILENIGDKINIWYDPSTGSSGDDRVWLNETQEIDIYEKSQDKSIDYYLNTLHTAPCIGDIVILKTLIPNTNKYLHDVFIYNNYNQDSNESKWCKLSNSYNSLENIFFTNDFKFSSGLNGENIITITAGTSIQNAFKQVFSQDKNPKIQTPCPIISEFPSGKFPIGKSLSLTYSLTLDPGDYEFGPGTEVTINKTANNNQPIIIEIIKNDKVDKQLYTSKLIDNLGSIIVDNETNCQLQVSIYHTDGVIAKTLQGNEYEINGVKQRISRGISQYAITEPITGFIPGMYYGCLDEIIDFNSVTKQELNDICKTRLTAFDDNYIKGYTTSLKIPKGTKMIIIACPTESDGISKVYNNTVSADMTDIFVNSFIQPVSIAGGDNNWNYASNYKLSYYIPAEEYEYETELTITL